MNVIIQIPEDRAALYQEQAQIRGLTVERGSWSWLTRMRPPAPSLIFKRRILRSGRGSSALGPIVTIPIRPVAVRQHCSEQSEIAPKSGSADRIWPPFQALAATHASAL
jgi:hypothetical protein